MGQLSTLRKPVRPVTADLRHRPRCRLLRFGSSAAHQRRTVEQEKASLRLSRDHIRPIVGEFATAKANGRLPPGQVVCLRSIQFPLALSPLACGLTGGGEELSSCHLWRGGGGDCGAGQMPDVSDVACQDVLQLCRYLHAAETQSANQKFGPGAATPTLKLQVFGVPTGGRGNCLGPSFCQSSSVL